MKVLENYQQKMSLIAFFLKNSRCPIHPLITMSKTDSAAVSEKLQNRASVVESHFSKARETSMFCSSVEEDVHGMFRKVAFLEISRSSLLTGVVGLLYSVCKAT